MTNALMAIVFNAASLLPVGFVDIDQLFRVNQPNTFTQYVYKIEDVQFISSVYPNIRPAIIQTNVTTTAIPSAIQQVASAYKSKMEEIYGAGAATNRALTRSYVAIDLSLNPAISADTGLRLATWFDILNEYWGKDEIWSYPWGRASYSVTNVTEVWEAVTP